MVDAKLGKEALRAELRAKLRGYNGLTPGKLQGCPEIQRLYGTTNLTLCFERLRADVMRLGDGRNALALRNALGIEPVSNGYLKYRRKAFGELHGNRDVETVETWENQAIDELVTQMLEETDVLRLVPSEPEINSRAIGLSGVVQERRLIRVFNIVTVTYIDADGDAIIKNSHPEDLSLVETDKPRSFIVWFASDADEASSLSLDVMFDTQPLNVWGYKHLTFGEFLLRRGPRKKLRCLSQANPWFALHVDRGEVVPGRVYVVEWEYPELRAVNQTPLPGDHVRM